MDLPDLLLYAAAVVVATVTLTVLARVRRERLAVDITRPLPARPPAGGHEYRRRHLR